MASRCPALSAGLGCLLDDLLMTALHRAIAFTEVDDASFEIACDLDLDMAWIGQELLHVEGSVAKCSLRFAPRQGKDRLHVGVVLHQGDTAAAAAGRRLEEDRIADLPGDRSGFDRVTHHTVGTWQHRNPEVSGLVARRHLVAHQANVFAARSDEGDAMFLDDLGKPAVLGQEAVPRMDGIGAGDLGSGEDGRNIEIAVACRRRTDAHTLIGKADMHRVGVHFGMDCDGADTHFPAGPVDAKGHLTAIGDENLVKHAPGR